jgi:hypothetical protein
LVKAAASGTEVMIDSVVLTWKPQKLTEETYPLLPTAAMPSSPVYGTASPIWPASRKSTPKKLIIDESDSGKTVKVILTELAATLTEKVDDGEKTILVEDDGENMTENQTFFVKILVIHNYNSLRDICS